MRKVFDINSALKAPYIYVHTYKNRYNSVIQKLSLDLNIKFIILKNVGLCYINKKKS